MDRRNEMSEIKCEGCGNWFTPRNNETTACDECNEKAELEEGTYGTYEWQESDRRLEVLSMMSLQVMTFDYSITYDFEGGTK